LFVFSLFEIVEDALRSAVEAGKGRSDAADDAFATAEEQLDLYAAIHHASEQFVSLAPYRTTPQHSHFSEPFSGTFMISLRMLLRRTARS